MQNNWKYNFGHIAVKFLLWILSVGIRSLFSKKSASVGIGQPFLKTISLISTICGVLTRTHLADSWRYRGARISRVYWRRASFPVFWKTAVFFDVLSWCSLSVKLQSFFRFAFVALLGCCEFNPNVTCVRIHVCSRIAMPHTAGAWWKASGSAKRGCFRLLWLTEKNDGGIMTR